MSLSKTSFWVRREYLRPETGSEHSGRYPARRSRDSGLSVSCDTCTSTWASGRSWGELLRRSYRAPARRPRRRRRRGCRRGPEMCLFSVAFGFSMGFTGPSPFSLQCWMGRWQVARWQHVGLPMSRSLSLGGTSYGHGLYLGGVYVGLGIYVGHQCGLVFSSILTSLYCSMLVAMISILI